METLGHALGSRSSDKANNFLIIRLFAASAVIFGHSFHLTSGAYQYIYYDPVTALLHYRYSGDVGLHIFFFLSGLLVTASFAQRDNLGQFLVSRALRIFPALFVAVVIIALPVGMLLTRDSWISYISNPWVWSFVSWNVSLLDTRFNLPGVFESNVGSSSAVGTLWTLPTEARLYVLIGLFGAVGFIRHQVSANLSLGLLVLVAVQHPHYFPTIAYGSGDNMRLAAFFAAGVFAYVNRDVVRSGPGPFAIACLVASLSVGTPVYEYTFGAAICLGVLYVGFLPKIDLPPWVQDYSYGIYLYGWPIQQILVKLVPTINPIMLTALALPAAWLAGAASWHWIEKPVLALKPRRSM